MYFRTLFCPFFYYPNASLFVSGKDALGLRAQELFDLLKNCGRKKVFLLGGGWLWGEVGYAQ